MIELLDAFSVSFLYIEFFQNLISCFFKTHNPG